MNTTIPSDQKRTKIPLPKEKFEDFYVQFDTVREILATDEWDRVYQHYYDFSPQELDIKIRETVEEQNAYDPHRQMQEIIKCAENFSYWCHKYVKITHPMHGLIPFIMYQYQHRVIEEYEDHRFNILRKFRQGGLTTVSVLWALWRCLFRTDQQIMVMSKTDREAIAAGEVAKKAMQYIPDWMQPQMGKSNEHEKQFIDTGSTLWFYTPEAARGKSITLLIIDEAAFIADMEKHWKAMYPVISTGGACCVVSTVNGIGNWYEEIYHGAEADENPFNIINLHYTEHPEYNDPKWVRDTKANLGDKGWKQEVLGDFLSSGETYFSTEIIAELKELCRDNYPLRMAFSKWKNSNIKDRSIDWDEGALWIFKEPVDGHEYIIGVDCAEGVGESADNSAFQILDVTTLEQVAEFYSNLVPPHIFSQVLNEIGYYYNTALIVVENQNQGGAVLSALNHDLAYENIYYDDQKGKANQPGMKTNRTNRPIFLETLQHRLNNRSVKINSRRFVSELETFIFNPSTKKAEPRKNKHDDAIMAMCFALYIRDTQMRGIPVGGPIPDEMIKIFKTEVYEEIKKEIMDGSPEDWLSIDNDDDPSLIPNPDDVLPGIVFDYKRKNDKLLREFGWAINWFILGGNLLYSVIV